MLIFNHDFVVLDDCNVLDDRWSGSLALSDVTSDIEGNGIKVEWVENGLEENYVLLSFRDVVNLSNKILGFWLYQERENRNTVVKIKLEDEDGFSKSYDLINFTNNVNFSKNYYPNSFGKYWNFIKIYCLVNVSDNIDLTKIKKIYFIFSRFEGYFLIDYIVAGRKYIISSDSEISFREIEQKQEEYYLRFFDNASEIVNNYLIQSYRIYCDVYFKDECYLNESFKYIKGRFYWYLNGLNDSQKCRINLYNFKIVDLYDYFNVPEMQIDCHYVELNLDSFAIQNSDNFNPFVANRGLKINGNYVSSYGYSLFPNKYSSFEKCYFSGNLTNINGSYNNCVFNSNLEVSGDNNSVINHGKLNKDIIYVNNNFNGNIILNNVNLNSDELQVICDIAANNNGNIERRYDLKVDIKGWYWKNIGNNQYKKEYVALSDFTIKLYDKNKDLIFENSYSDTTSIFINNILVEKIDIVNNVTSHYMYNPLVLKIYEKNSKLVYKKAFNLNKKDYVINVLIDYNPKKNVVDLTKKVKDTYTRKAICPESYNCVSKLKNTNYYLILSKSNRLYCADRNNNLLFYYPFFDKKVIKVCGFHKRFYHIFVQYEDFSCKVFVHNGNDFFESYNLNINGILQDIYVTYGRNPETYFLEKIFWLIYINFNKQVVMKKILNDENVYINLSNERMLLQLPDDIIKEKTEASGGLIFVESEKEGVKSFG